MFALKAAMLIRMAAILQVLSILKIEKKSQVPEDYAKSFREAVSVFHHARM